MKHSAILINLIDIGDRLRSIDPAWVELLAEEMGAHGQQEPIHVVERGDRYHLLAGARRLAAAKALGWKEIGAAVIPAGDLADEAAIRLAEIKADIMRADLTVLDRARYIAAWRDIYVSTHEISKGGRKRRDTEGAEELSAKFALSFSDAARQALQISRRSLYLALKVASIDPDVAARIALHPIANVQRELLLLADQSSPLQSAIATLLANEPDKVTTVAEALMQFGGVVSPAPEPAYARLSARFSRLPEKEQFAFFAMHESAIDLWLARRAAAARKAA